MEQNGNFYMIIPSFHQNQFFFIKSKYKEISPESPQSGNCHNTGKQKSLKLDQYLKGYILKGQLNIQIHKCRFLDYDSNIVYFVFPVKCQILIEKIELLQYQNHLKLNQVMKFAQVRLGQGRPPLKNGKKIDIIQKGGRVKLIIPNFLR